MIASMTGYAAVAADLPGVSLAVELRSVNHRYLDLQLRLPDELRGLESALRERIAGESRRGKVECRVALNRTTPGAAAFAVDATRVLQLASAATAIQRHVPDAAPLSVNEILRWPGVLAEPTIAPEELAAKVQELLGTALRDLAASRAREERARRARRLKHVARRSRIRLRASLHAFPPCMPPTSKSSGPGCAKRASTPTRIG